MDLIKKETARRNMVTVIVVHDTNIALRYDDYVLMLNMDNLLLTVGGYKLLRQNIWRESMVLMPE